VLEACHRVFLTSLAQCMQLRAPGQLRCWPRNRPQARQASSNASSNCVRGSGCASAAMNSCIAAVGCKPSACWPGPLAGSPGAMSGGQPFADLGQREIVIGESSRRPVSRTQGPARRRALAAAVRWMSTSMSSAKTSSCWSSRALNMAPPPASHSAIVNAFPGSVATKTFW